MGRVIRFVKRFKLSNRNLLIIILLVLTLPSVYKFIHNNVSDYLVKSRMLTEQRDKEEAQKLKDNKINSFLDKYEVQTVTINGLTFSISEYFDAKDNVLRKYKEYGWTCEKLPVKGDFKSDSFYFKEVEEELANFSLDFFTRDCLTIQTTQSIYDQFVKEREEIQKLILENKQSPDEEIKEYVRLLELDMEMVGFRESLRP